MLIIKNKVVKRIMLILVLAILAVTIVKIHNLYMFYKNTRYLFPNDNTVNFIDFLIGVAQGQ